MITEASLEKVTNSGDEELISGFVEDCKLRNLTPRTVQEYVGCLRIISKSLHSFGSSITSLDNRDVLKRLLAYLTRDHNLSFKTLGNYFSALSTFCDYLVYEEIATRNPIPPFRKRFIRQYKNTIGDMDHQRRLISVEDMARLINSILDPRDKAIITLLTKTGIRRNELVRLDLEDVDWIEQSLQLKPHPKRSNCTVFFDDETAKVLQRWIRTRKNCDISPDNRALFVNEVSERLGRNGIYRIVTKHAQRVGLHDPESKRMEDHFMPHCCRHWFTTYLRKNGMSREFIKELRGDTRKEAIDIYDHIDRKELKRAYLAAIPVLDIA